MIVHREKTFILFTSETERDERCLGEIFKAVGEKANLALHLSPLREGFYFTVKIKGS